MFDINGDLTNDSGVGALVTGIGTVTLSRSGGSQLVGGAYPIDFQGLTINNPSGITLGYDVTISGALTLTSGDITTGVHTLSIAPTGSVSRTSGHIVGNLRKQVPTGAPSLTYEVGDATQYAPVALSFSSVTVAADLTLSTTGGDHAALAGSSIDPTQSANRFWTLSSPGLGFTDFAATFNFGATDIDAGADTSDFGVALYAGGAWQSQLTGTQSSASTQATGITAFGDFAVGELAAGALHHFVVAAPSTADAGTAFDVTVTAVDAVGNRVGSYVGTIAFSSTDTHAAFSPPTYAFQVTDHGTRTFSGGSTLYAAGNRTVTATDSAIAGTSGFIAVAPGPFVKLQILVPGQVSDPGSTTGNTGTVTGQTANTPFNVSINAVDAYWNVVSATDTVAITSSDGNAYLPADAALVGGSITVSVTAQTGGPTTFTATDVSDGTKTAATSDAIAVTNTAPTAADDTYELFADNTLVVAAAGVLANDTDPELQPLTVAAPRPQTGPDHGSLTLNADGSFSYTPAPGFSGTDTFTYVAADAGVASAAGTVTLRVRDHSLISASGWGTDFDTNRYIDVAYPAYVPAGAVISEVTLHFSYRSLDSLGTTCFYLETYSGATLLATHGSATTPLSCNAGSSYVMDDVSLAEVDTVAEANDLTIRILMRNSAAARSQINLAVLTFDYSVP
jgi:hypothetical protein